MLYLHHVLNTWFTWINESHYGSSARMIRYADDAVFSFRTLVEAEQFGSFWRVDSQSTGSPSMKLRRRR